MSHLSLYVLVQAEQQTKCTEFLHGLNVLGHGRGGSVGRLLLSVWQTACLTNCCMMGIAPILQTVGGESQMPNHIFISPGYQNVASTFTVLLDYILVCRI
jgi:hypothetical protein